jgi:hypothetical protein
MGDSLMARQKSAPGKNQIDFIGAIGKRCFRFLACGSDIFTAVRKIHNSRQADVRACEKGARLRHEWGPDAERSYMDRQIEGFAAEPLNIARRAIVGEICEIDQADGAACESSISHVSHPAPEKLQSAAPF